MHSSQVLVNKIDLGISFTHMLACLTPQVHDLFLFEIAYQPKMGLFPLAIRFHHINTKVPALQHCRLPESFG